MLVAIPPYPLSSLDVSTVGELATTSFFDMLHRPSSLHLHEETRARDSELISPYHLQGLRHRFLPKHAVPPGRKRFSNVRCDFLSVVDLNVLPICHCHTTLVGPLRFCCPATTVTPTTPLSLTQSLRRATYFCSYPSRTVARVNNLLCNQHGWRSRPKTEHATWSAEG